MSATSDSVLEREFAFTTLDFERIRALIYERAGISLTAAKQNMVYSRLSRRLRTRSLKSFSDYLDLLEGGDAEEWQAFTNALTTNLTAFFREAHHFPLLAEHLRAQARNIPITLWCAAASTGEEPYSMAMTACETFGTLAPPVRIIASDIDTQVLAAAARGIYSLDKLAALSQERLTQFFQRGTGAHEGSARVRPELKALVDFRQINLLHPSWPVPCGLAAIFCRNVMIYFKQADQLEILARFAPLLPPGGLLFAGHSESFLHQERLFRLRGKTVYVRQPHASA